MRSLPPVRTLASTKRRSFSDKDANGPLAEKDSLLEEMGHAEFTRSILRALNRVSDKDKKHIIRTILSPEDGGKIILRPKRHVDDYVGDQAGLTKEFFEEIPETAVAEWSFQAASGQDYGCYILPKR